MEHLADLYRHLQGQSQQENDVILIGHFGVDLIHLLFAKLIAIDHGMSYVVKDESTVIRGHRVEDNIISPRHFLQEFTDESRVGRFDEEYFEGKTTFACTRVLFHRPVWATFKSKICYDENLTFDIMIV